MRLSTLENGASQGRGLAQPFYSKSALQASTYRSINLVRARQQIP